MALRYLLGLRAPLGYACGPTVVTATQVATSRGWCSAFTDAAAVETRSSWAGSNTASPLPVSTSNSAASPAHNSSSNCSSNSSGVSSLPETLQQAYRTLSTMGLHPGIECVVGDGLAVVDLGVFVQGKQIALELKQKQTGGQSAAVTARNFALARVRERALEAHGWTIAYITEQEWQKAGQVSSNTTKQQQQQQQEGPGGLSVAEHRRMHYLLEVLKEAVGTEGHHHHHHHHDGSCGCH